MTRPTRHTSTFCPVIVLACAITLSCTTKTASFRVDRTHLMGPFSLTTQPAELAVVVEVLEYPGESRLDEQLILLIQYGPTSQSRMLTRGGTGNVLDPETLPQGSVIRVRPPIEPQVPCPVLTDLGRVTRAATTPDGLKCYAVDIQFVALE